MGFYLSVLALLEFPLRCRYGLCGGAALHGAGSRSGLKKKEDGGLDTVVSGLGDP